MLDKNDKSASADARRSYEGGIDDDARSAYEEVLGRIKSATSDETGDDSSASRSAPEKAERTVDEKPVETREGRDPKGRFAPKAGDDKAPVDKAAKPADKTVDEKPADAKPEDQQQEPQQPANAPPPSFSAATKAEWAKLPQHVRDDIAKREAEMSNGLKALQEFKDLKPYQELAVKNNTTIPKALDHFIRMENLIRQDIGAGFAMIAQNRGMSQAQAAELFAGLAQKFGAKVTAPTQGNQPQGQPAADADPLVEALAPVLDKILGPLKQKVETVHGHYSSREMADRNAQAQSLTEALETFASDPANEFYGQLEGQMVMLVQKGIVPLTGNYASDLKAAYEMAASMNTDVRNALIEKRAQAQVEALRKAEQEAADRAKAAARSLSGSRAPGSTVVEKQPTSSGSYDADLEADVIRAMRSRRA